MSSDFPMLPGFLFNAVEKFDAKDREASCTRRKVTTLLFEARLLAKSQQLGSSSEKMIIVHSL